MALTKIIGDGVGTVTGNITQSKSGTITNSFITSSTDSYAELLFQDGNAGYGLQVRSDNAQSTGTGSFLINDRDTGSFPVVIKEGNASNTLVLSGSNVGIGTTNPIADFVVSNGGAAGIELQPEIATDTNRITNFDRAASAYMNFKLDALTHQFLTSGTERFRIASNGDLTGTDTSISSNSDERLKKDIEDYSYSMDIFKQYKPKSFNWKNPEPHGNKVNQKGFLAQDIKKLDEQWVGEIDLNRDSLDCDLITENSDGKRNALTSKFGEKDAMYISIIQQLESRIEKLENK